VVSGVFCLTVLRLSVPYDDMLMFNDAPNSMASEFCMDIVAGIGCG
jgi:hypothetical protein